MTATTYLFLAYTAAFVLLFFYDARMSRRQQRLEQELDALKQNIQEMSGRSD